MREGLPMKPDADRLVSLDTFRGATIAAMILVNNPGDWGHIYWPLEHAPWHGWTPTDLVFPFFLFMVGMSLTLSRRQEARSAMARAARLIGLGLFMAGFPAFHLSTLRWPGAPWESSATATSARRWRARPAPSTCG